MSKKPSYKDFLSESVANTYKLNKIVDDVINYQKDDQEIEYTQDINSVLERYYFNQENTDVISEQDYDSAFGPGMDKMKDNQGVTEQEDVEIPEEDEDKKDEDKKEEKKEEVSESYSDAESSVLKKLIEEMEASDVERPALDNPGEKTKAAGEIEDSIEGDEEIPEQEAGTLEEQETPDAITGEQSAKPEGKEIEDEIVKDEETPEKEAGTLEECTLSALIKEMESQTTQKPVTGSQSADFEGDNIDDEIVSDEETPEQEAGTLEEQELLSLIREVEEEIGATEEPKMAAEGPAEEAKAAAEEAKGAAEEAKAAAEEAKEAVEEKQEEKEEEVKEQEETNKEDEEAKAAADEAKAAADEAKAAADEAKEAVESLEGTENEVEDTEEEEEEEEEFDIDSEMSEADKKILEENFKNFLEQIEEEDKDIVDIKSKDVRL